MGEQDRTAELPPNSLASSSLGRAILEGLWSTPPLRVMAEFGELSMLRATLNGLDVPIAVLDSQGRILVANTAAHDAALANWSAAAAFQSNSDYLVALDSETGEFSKQARALASGIREVIAGGREEFVIEYSCPGAATPRHVRVRVTRCSGTEACRAIVTQQDISEQRRAQQARDHAQLLLDTVLDTAPVGITIAEGPEATIRQINRRGQDLLNCSLNDMEGASLEEYLSRVKMLRTDGETPAFAEDLPMMRALRTGEIVRNEDLVLRLPDGTQFTIACNASPVRDFAGNIRGSVVAWWDVTHGRLLEEELRQSHKMEAIGQLAGGVAHDFNNLLMVIQGYSQMLRRRVSNDSYLTSAVDEIHKATDRASTLTRQLLAFGRKQVLQPQVLDMNTVVTDMEGMLRRTIGEDIQMVSLQEPGLMPVKADRAQLEQVVLNLAVNSRDAMPRGGTLTLETCNVEVDEAMARNHRGLSPGRYSTLAVRDTGEGMDAKTKERIFEPFFTTKEKGKGTGLGLATVYGIVKQSGGYIAVDSAPGRGTTFRVFLPCEERTAAACPAADVAPPESPAGTETILLVEDEEKVRKIVRDFLGQSGYSVLQAQNGEEALDLAQKHSPIDLLLTDLVMPGLGGRELAVRLTQLLPNLRVVLMSGYASWGKGGPEADQSEMILLQKPFRLEELGRKVREVLDASATPYS